MDFIHAFLLIFQLLFSILIICFNIELMAHVFLFYLLLVENIILWNCQCAWNLHQLLLKFDHLFLLLYIFVFNRRHKHLHFLLETLFLNFLFLGYCSSSYLKLNQLYLKFLNNIFNSLLKQLLFWNFLIVLFILQVLLLKFNSEFNFLLIHLLFILIIQATLFRFILI